MIVTIKTTKEELLGALEANKALFAESDNELLKDIAGRSVALSTDYKPVVLELTHGSIAFLPADGGVVVEYIVNEEKMLKFLAFSKNHAKDLGELFNTLAGLHDYVSVVVGEIKEIIDKHPAVKAAVMKAIDKFRTLATAFKEEV